MNQAEAPARAHARQEGSPGALRERRSNGRLLAEWVSLGISVLLIAGIAGYLLRQAMLQEHQIIQVEVTPRIESSVKAGDTYVLPVELRNPSTRTLKDLIVELSYTPPQGDPEERELEVAYLGERSTQILYVYLEHDPRRVSVEVKPQSYRLE